MGSSLFSVPAIALESLTRLMKLKKLVALLTWIGQLFIFHATQGFPDRPVKIVVPTLRGAAGYHGTAPDRKNGRRARPASDRREPG